MPRFGRIRHAPVCRQWRSGRRRGQACAAFEDALAEAARTMHGAPAQEAILALPSLNEADARALCFALQLGDDDIAQHIYETLEHRQSELAVPCLLYLCEAQRRPLPAAALDCLRSEAGASPFLLHARVHFAAQLGLGDDERSALAARLPDPSPQELFWRAQFVERTEEGDRRAIVNAYRKACDAGSMEAGQRLVSLACEEPDLKSRAIQLKELADRLVPKAAFLYAQTCFSEEGYQAKAYTYLRIACALDDRNAIAFYADMLYQKVLRFDRKSAQVLLKMQRALYDTQDSTELKALRSQIKSQKKRTDEKWRELSSDLATAIALYRSIVEHSSGASEDTLRLGVLLHISERYSTAMQHLQRCTDRPEAAYRLGDIYQNGKGVSRNPKKAMEFFQAAAAAGHPLAAQALDVLQAQQRSEEAKRAARLRERRVSYNRDADYSSRTHLNSVDEGCFITTATCMSEGKPDDCPELTAFRRYRDTSLLQTPQGRALVREYYRIAPQIVRAINAEPQAREIYRSLYDDYIAPGYALLAQGRSDEAKALYIQCVLSLAKRFSIPTTQASALCEEAAPPAHE